LTTETTRLLSPEEIAVRAGGEAAFLRLPQPRSMFAERGARLRQRAAGHPMRDYLMFVAELAQAQHETAGSMPALALPDAAAIDAAPEAPPGGGLVVTRPLLRDEDGWQTSGRHP
jgi:FdhE protein